MASPSYRERMKAQRAEARAQREAEKAGGDDRARATVRNSKASDGRGQGRHRSRRPAWSASANNKYSVAFAPTPFV